jgi:hypothetical protein
MEFPSWKAASKEMGHAIRFIKKYYKTERVFDEGHWANTDIEYLKSIAISKSKAQT